jgi:hypothetical protein
MRSPSSTLFIVALCLVACPPPTPTLPTLPTSFPPSVTCSLASGSFPGFPGGTPVGTVTFTVSSIRQLRRSGGFLGGTCNVTRAFNWPIGAPAGVTRIASYVDDCGGTDEESALLVFDFTALTSALAGKSPKTCRVISASALFTTTNPTRTNLPTAAGEAINCVGKVDMATNAAWMTIPAEDYRSNQFLNATSGPVDPPGNGLLPIHVPARAGEPAVPSTWGLSPNTFSVDLTQAVQSWIDLGAANNGIVIFPQTANLALNDAKGTGQATGGCLWDFSMGVGTVRYDASP